ncbi:MAG TPA: Fur family transcriptional regulator [Pseudomonadales bacterium]|nr:Fur family transcriptional regulator [Pseudomonadales bacterium]
MPIDNYIDRLKGEGHRVTPKVRAVIEVFLERKSILDPFEVQARLQKRFKGVGLPTVYRILENLANCGILVAVANEDRELRYFICRGIEHGHHHHFICCDCGKVDEVNLCLMDEVSKYVKRHLKATVQSHFLQIEGLCEKCGRNGRPITLDRRYESRASTKTPSGSVKS